MKAILKASAFCLAASLGNVSPAAEGVELQALNTELPSVPVVAAFASDASALAYIDSSLNLRVVSPETGIELGSPVRLLEVVPSLPARAENLRLTSFSVSSGGSSVVFADGITPEPHFITMATGTRVSFHEKMGEQAFLSPVVKAVVAMGGQHAIAKDATLDLSVWMDNGHSARITGGMGTRQEWEPAALGEMTFLPGELWHLLDVPLLGTTDEQPGFLRLAEVHQAEEFQQGRFAGTQTIARVRGLRPVRADFVVRQVSASFGGKRVLLVGESFADLWNLENRSYLWSFANPKDNEGGFNRIQGGAISESGDILAVVYAAGAMVLDAGSEMLIGRQHSVEPLQLPPQGHQAVVLLSAGATDLYVVRPGHGYISKIPLPPRPCRRMLTDT